MIWNSTLSKDRKQPNVKEKQNLNKKFLKEDPLLSCNYNLQHSQLQYFPSLLFITQILSSSPIKYTTLVVVFWLEETLIQDNKHLCKVILIILLLWIAMKIGLLAFNKDQNQESEYGLIISVSVVSNVHMKKLNKFDSAIKSIWQWQDQINIKGK